MRSIPTHALYAITDTSLCANLGLETAVRAALEGGAGLIQYRDKSNEHPRREREAKALAALCRDFGALLIINDDPQLAGTVDADGVHLGKDDNEVADARQQLGGDKIIGVSCYNSPDRARTAALAGADYIAFGRFFPSTVKPNAPAAELSSVYECRELGLPIAAIGGVTVDNAPTLIEAGVNLLAVIGAIFGHPDPKQAALAFKQLLDGH